MTYWLSIVSPVAVLAGWEAATSAGLLREAFFPRPSTILLHLRRLVADGTLLGHLLPTLARIAGDMVVCVGYCEADGEERYNAAICLTGDGVLGRHRKVHLVGWSLGGGVVMQYAIDHPEEVASLTLIAVQSWNLMVAHPVQAEPFNFRRRSTS